MEKMELTLYQLLQQQNRVPLHLETVRHLLFQMASGLYHIHSHGFIHRDIKPENILVARIPAKEYSFVITRSESSLSPPQLYTVKLADFGLSRHSNCQDPYTSYVSTRWYRAPEMILQSDYYSSAVDMWALGAVAYEIVQLSPLFPGNDALDQISRYTHFLGTPSDSCLGGNWPAYYDFMNKCHFSIPKCDGANVSALGTDPCLQSAIRSCLQWNACRRITSLGFLYHKLFLSDEELCEDDPSFLDDYTFADGDSSNYCVTKPDHVLAPPNDFLCSLSDTPGYSSI
ncbi:hypothetical protein TRVA0_003S02498 [Trichomonascus vanleenenianus]|uniref:protein kinase IME2 n=1 Tax=Trichomonascus vanleenenianus TaxID=2268995 RepID=UPI003ECAB18E